MSEGPLSGVVVLDLSRVLAGPFATMMLGDLGATVLKVERPEGDDTRYWGPPFVGPADARESVYFLSINRNKKSIVLDFKRPEDMVVLRRLIQQADILVENFRVGTMERLGLSHESLLELNPRLVVVSNTGFGHDGPEADRPAYDQIMQGESGFMSITGPSSDEPYRMGLPICDMITGIFVAFGALAALRERDLTGRGRIVRSSLLASSVAIQAFYGARYLIAGEVTKPAGNGHSTLTPYGTYRAADGLLQLAVGNDGIWRKFAPLVGLAPDDPRFVTNSNRIHAQPELDRLISERLIEKPVAEWLALCLENDVPAGEIKTLDKVYEWAQTLSQGLVVELDHPTAGKVKVPGPPLRFDGDEPKKHEPPPMLGEHNAEVLRWLDEQERAASEGGK